MAAVVAFTTEFIIAQKFIPVDFLVLVASSLTSSVIACIVLGKHFSNTKNKKVNLFIPQFVGLILITIILISKKLEINPDNVATPIAGSIGDIGTLITLATVGTFFYKSSKCFEFSITCQNMFFFSFQKETNYGFMVFLYYPSSFLYHF